MLVGRQTIILKVHIIQNMYVYYILNINNKRMCKNFKDKYIKINNNNLGNISDFICFRPN
jgi:hypothetical protein